MGFFLLNLLCLLTYIFILEFNFFLVVDPINPEHQINLLPIMNNKIIKKNIKKTNSPAKRLAIK